MLSYKRRDITRIDFLDLTAIHSFAALFHSRSIDVTFFRIVLFAKAGFDFHLAALIAAERFLVAATMALLPASVTFRLDFEPSGVACAGASASGSPWILA
jgi:hypothetical protein